MLANCHVTTQYTKYENVVFLEATMPANIISAVK
jgi:hypothetical protein